MKHDTCTIAGCEGKHLARGWCSRHYTNWRRRGDALAEGTRRYRTPKEAFNARTVRDGECLVWCGSRTRDGYGFISVGGRLEMTHRYAWIAEYGAVPDGCEVDHSCGNRACCDVAHLRLATRHENMRNRAGAQTRSATGIRNVRAAGSSFRVDVDGDYVGTFRDIESAAAAAEVARIAKFGEFAGVG